MDLNIVNFSFAKLASFSSKDSTDLVGNNVDSRWSMFNIFGVSYLVFVSCILTVKLILGNNAQHNSDYTFRFHKYCNLDKNKRSIM